MSCSQALTASKLKLEPVKAREQDYSDPRRCFCTMHIVVFVLRQAFQHTSLTLGLRFHTSNSPAMVSIRPETSRLFPPPPTVLASATASRCEDKQ